MNAGSPGRRDGLTRPGFVLSTLLLFILVSCAPAPVRLEVAAGTPCRYRTERAGFTGKGLAAYAPTWRGRRALILAGPNSSYRCIGGAIYALQRAGVRRIKVPGVDLP